MTSDERVRQAAELIVLLREEEAAEPAEIMWSVRHDFPDVTMAAVFAEVTESEQTRGNA